MRLILFVLTTLLLSNLIIAGDLEGSHWLVHNGDVVVEFWKSQEKYQAVAIEVSPDFGKASPGDTIVRNIQFHQESGILEGGTIRMGALSANFSATLENDSLLNITIQKLFITKQYKWKRIFNKGKAK